MNSKLPPKYTCLFLLLFILNTNKGECAQTKCAKLYSAVTVISSKAFFVYTPPSIVSDTILTIDKMAVKSDLESYQWFMNRELRIRS